MNQHPTHDDAGGESDATELREILAEAARSEAVPTGVVLPDDPPNDHPDDSALAAYLGSEDGSEGGATDALDAGREEEIRAHLVACRRCTQRLLDLDALAVPDPAPADDEPVDFARAAAWRAFRQAQHRRQSVPLRTFGAVAATLLALLAVAYVLGPGLGERSASGFEENVAIHYLDELTRSRSFETSEIAVDADAAYWVLVLAPPADAPRYPRYVVELFRDGERIERFELVPTELETLQIGIRTADLPPGEARLVLSGVPEAASADGEAVEIEEYPLHIAYR